MRQILQKLNRKVYPKHLFYNPSWMILGVNNVCNLHCKMCDVGTQTTSTNFSQNLVGSHPLHMPLDLFQKMADQCADFFPDIKLGYAFTEPLIYKHLDESLLYAQHKKLATSITTNGLNLKQKADIVVQSEVENLFLSLDGTASIHNEIRGHKKSFERAIQGIESVLAQTNKINISVFFVITEWNTNNMVDFVEYFKQYPITHIGFLHPNYTLQSTADTHNQQLISSQYPATHSNIEELDPTQINLKKVQEQVAEIKSREYPFKVSFQPELNSPKEYDDFYLKPNHFIGKGCTDVYQNIMLKSDGQVIPAHGRCYQVNAGNLYEDDLKTIWNSKILSDFRSDLNKSGGYFPACSRCCSAF